MKDIRFMKYPRIPHLYEIPEIVDHGVEVYEKIDGGNAQIRKLDGRTRCGNRANFLDDKRFDQFWFRDFLKFVMKNDSFYNLPENIIVFCEWLAPHTLDYKEECKNRAYLTDVYDKDRKLFLPYQEGKEVLVDKGIEELVFLDCLFTGKISINAIKWIAANKKSRFRDNDKKMEGVVVKDYAGQRFAKLLRRMVLGERQKVDMDDIRRAKFSLIDDGMSMNYPNLLEKVMSNLQEERRKFDEKKVKSLVSMSMNKD